MGANTKAKQEKKTTFSIVVGSELGEVKAFKMSTKYLVVMTDKGFHFMNKTNFDESFAKQRDQNKSFEIFFIPNFSYKADLSELTTEEQNVLKKKSYPFEARSFMIGEQFFLTFTIAPWSALRIWKIPDSKNVDMNSVPSHSSIFSMQSGETTIFPYIFNHCFSFNSKLNCESIYFFTCQGHLSTFDTSPTLGFNVVLQELDFFNFANADKRKAIQVNLTEEKKVSPQDKKNEMKSKPISKDCILC
jgi:hypothetical protein